MPKFLIDTQRPDGSPGPTLRYDTEISSLVDAATGARVAPEVVVQRSGDSVAFATSATTPAGKRSPRVLKISLGLSCNYECEYCSQRFVPRADETNPGEVSGFLAGLDEWVKEPPEKIEFWGGEPLVYIKTMRPLAEALRVKYPDSKLSIISNGSLLTTEINEWLDRLGFSVGISHDGPGQHVRGPDPLDDPVRRAAILDLYQRLRPQGRMSFNSMMNRHNVSRLAVVEFFKALTGDPFVPIGEGAMVDAYDDGGLQNSLQEDEFAAYRQQAFREIRNGGVENFQFVGQKISSFLNSIRTARPSSALGQKCGMDEPDNLAVDLRGNVVTCQNVSPVSTAPNGESHKIGHVTDLNSASLKTATHWSHRDECPKCPMLHICQGACMFLEGPLWDKTCDNAFSDAVPIFAATIEFLTGTIPVRIAGAHRADRQNLWEVAVKPKPRVIPINAARPA